MSVVQTGLERCIASVEFKYSICWRNHCSMKGDCGFTKCNPPKERHEYYDFKPITWKPDSREEELANELKDATYQKFLIEDTTCGCGNCDEIIINLAVEIAVAALAEKCYLLQVKLGRLTKACVKDPSKY
jgi:hypothetical protein